MDLNQMLVFAKVVESGGFGAAARELGMPKSTVSRRIAALEERLDARLLQRTTRKLQLTEVGLAYYQHAAQALAAAERAELAVSSANDSPRGLLRVSAPLNLHYLGPIVTSFLDSHPEVQVELHCTDRLVDLVSDGFDLAIRAGNLADSSLIARRLGSLRSLLVASPAFVKAHGEPSAPEGLLRFACVIFGAGESRSLWQLSSGDKRHTVKVRGRFTVNDFEMLEAAAVAGQGVALLPAAQSLPAIASKRLVRLLPEWQSVATPLHVVYPSARFLPPKVRAFLDHLQAAHASAPGHDASAADA